MSDALYVENLAAAEALVRRGQFNAAKVLRALAHAQRAEAMEDARRTDVDLAGLLERNHATLTDPAARDIAARALASLAHHTRAETIALVERLTDADWVRKGTVRGTANSVLDLGSRLANHDVGHLAQAHR